MSSADASATKAPDSIDYQIDQISETANRLTARLTAQRDVYAKALREIVAGRHLFAHRLRQISNDAINEAAQL